MPAKSVKRKCCNSFNLGVIGLGNNAVLASRELCTGCAACYSCCPVDAIEMHADDEGFLCPVVDNNTCMGCGKCADVCPVIKERPALDKEPLCYAAWSRDDNIRLNSSSGGTFVHLARAVLENGGAVAGARYGENNIVEHAVIHKTEDVKQFQQSKYVQSGIGNVFREIKNELSNGKPLLFSGTPCQCAGLLSFLGKDYENLYTCDFICHGVNSPLVYAAYLHELEERFASKIIKVNFRDKTLGWYKFSMRIYFENGREYTAYHKSDPYMLGFLHRKLSMYMRRSCYECKFRKVYRPTDITLCDFWGVERCLPDVDNSKGVSAVMIHSEKGKKLWDICRSGVEQIPVNISDISLRNPSLTQNSSSGYSREEFFRELKTEDFSVIIKRALEENN